jgi:hypothetical protein
MIIHGKHNLTSRCPAKIRLACDLDRSGPGNRSENKPMLEFGTLIASVAYTQSRSALDKGKSASRHVLQTHLKPPESCPGCFGYETV